MPPPMTRVNFERVSGILPTAAATTASGSTPPSWTPCCDGSSSGESGCRTNEGRTRSRPARRSSVQGRAQDPEDARSAAFKNFDHDSGLDALPSVVKWLLEL
jgi:hypothetical protein